jgi:uncharacterized protein (DUF1778 family)
VENFPIDSVVRLWCHLIPMNEIKPKPAKRTDPGLRLRFRSKRELNDVRRAAKAKGLSLNTFILTVALTEARNYLSYSG